MKQVAQKKSLIPIMKQKEKELSPGSFRAYLEPSAVLEIVGLLNWRAFDFSAYKQGSAAFAKLADGKESLSAKFSIGENFELGLSPRFNSLGELAPQKLEVVTQGHLKNWLVSSRAAKEYGVNSNAGEGVFRSAEIACGNLPMASALKELGTGVALGNLHYLNWSDMPAARITGMTRYACFWVEKGEIVAPIKDMRFDESLYQILGRDLIDLTVENETSPNMLTYERREPGGFRTPGLLLSSLVFKM